MDPDALLNQMLDNARAIVGDISPHGPETADEEMAQQLLDLHDWIMKGGFLPAAWRSAAGASPIAGCDANGEVIRAWHGPLCVGARSSGPIRIVDGRGGEQQRQVQCPGCNAWFGPSLTGRVPDHPPAEAWEPDPNDAGIYR